MPDTRDLNEFVSAKDVEDGDILEIMDAGEIISTNFRKEDEDEKLVLQMGIRLPSGKVKKMTINRTNRENIAERFGPLTEHWIGIHVKVLKIKQSVFGEMKHVIHLKPVEEPADPPPPRKK